MAMIEKIRGYRWLLMGMVGIGLLSFLIPYDAVMSLFGGTNNSVGEIAGNTISAKEWQKALQDREPLFQYKGNEQSLSNDTWNQLVENYVYHDAYASLGLAISEEEYEEIMFGKMSSPFVKSVIYNGKDSLAIKEQVRKSFDGMDPAMAENWKQLVKDKRSKEKYDAMLKYATHANSIDAKWAFRSTGDRVAVEYVVKSYNEIPDSTITWDESDIKAYYNKHKNDRKYRQENSRDAEYIRFPVNPSAADSAFLIESLTKMKEDFRTAKDDSMFCTTQSGAPDAYANYTEGTFPGTIDALVKSDSVGRVLGPFQSGNQFVLAKISKRGLDNNTVQARHILIKDKEKGKAKLDSLLGVIKSKKNFEEMARQFSEDPGSGSQGGDLGKFGRGQMVKPFEDACFNGAVGSLQIVQSEFGWHLIEVTGKNFPFTKIAKISRDIEPRNETIKAAYASAKDFTINCSDTASFRAAAKNLNGGTQVIKAPNIRANATNVSGLSDAGEFVSWAFSAEMGEISQPMRIGNEYIIAALTDIREKGVPTLQNIYDQAKAEVIKQKKAEKYVELMKEGSLQDIASRISSEIKKAEKVTFRASNIPGSGISAQENKLVGICMGLEKDKISSPIIGEGGVYVVQRTGDIQSETSQDDYKSDKERQSMSYRQRAANAVGNALRESAKIEDYRYERR
jgi:parvulin-like peptidyl-prolyl isomerase